jgi:peptidoglycan/LPS O-acetylase OafA/YrhL
MRRALVCLSYTAVIALVVPYLEFVVTNQTWPIVLNPPMHQLVQAFCFAIIMAAGRADTCVNRALSCPAILFVGTLSYSLYLFQRIGAVFAGGTQTGAFSWDLFPRSLRISHALALGITFCAAFGTYHLVEVPCRSWLCRTRWLRARAVEPSFARS